MSTIRSFARRLFRRPSIIVVRGTPYDGDIGFPHEFAAQMAEITRFGSGPDQNTGKIGIPAHLINESSPSNYASAKVADARWSRKPAE